MSPLLLAIVCCLAVGSSCFEAPSRKSSGRLSLKTTLIAEHSRRTHRDDRLRAQEEPTSVEQLLPSILQRRERVSPTEAFDAAYASYESDEAAPSLNPNKNLFDTHHFDESYQTHSLCEAWNSGGHGDNVNLEWTESADRLLRIIGNGVVKDGYNMFMAPAQSHGQTTNISIAVYIESMSSFRAQTMDFEVDMYLATAWFDRRLAHNCTHPILVTHKFIADRIWQPDLYFVNSKFAYLQEVTTPNFMLIVYPDGLIFKSMRIDVTLSCMMDLKRFPMDVQECPMVIQSYAYVDNLVNLTWHVDPPNFPIGSNAEIKLNDMVITNTRYTRCSGPYPMFRGSGNWSCLCGFIVMKRLVLFHVIQTYIPTGMLVSISWMSFWLDPRASPARITLTITTLLTLTTMSNGARQDLPQVAYVKMLDLWLSFNQALIFLVLLEYAFVSYFLTRKNLNCEHKKVLSASASINNHMKTAPAERRLFRQDSPLTGMGAADRPIVNGNGVYLRQRHWSIDSGHHTTKAGINATAAMLCRVVNNTAALRSTRLSRTSMADLEAENVALMAATSHQTAKNYETLAKPCTQCSYENELIARKIDHYSRIIFPSAFGVFCSTYWLYYSWWDLQQ